LEDVIVVETTGNQIVAVKRTDIDLDSKKGREMALADNATAKANIDWDVEALNEDWSTEEQKEWGVEFPDFAVNLEAEEDDYEIPDTIQTDIVLGDLFEIGQHRLLCGDSTNADDVAKLMNGQNADALITDPPYGLGIDGQKQSIAKNPKHNRKAHEFKGWDNERPTKETFALILSIADKAVIWGGNYFADLLPATRGWIYWDKGQQGLTMSDGELAWTTESKPLRSITVNRAELKGSEHPTQKPVKVISFSINYIKDAELIADPFLGSGTTMVAAHQLNRKCYGMELDPKYCQVIVDRMLKLDPSLEIKRNGQPYISNKAEINAI
jgi:site-specific DNA-methyltransferase (adenine-specific)